MKLVAELVIGRRVEHDLFELDREEPITAASLGRSIADRKTVLAALQERIVDDQVRHQGESLRSCTHCGRKLVTKRHCNSTLRSVYSKVRMLAIRYIFCSPHHPQTNVKLDQCDAGGCLLRAMGENPESEGGSKNRRPSTAASGTIWAGTPDSAR